MKLTKKQLDFIYDMAKSDEYLSQHLHDQLSDLVENNKDKFPNGISEEEWDIAVDRYYDGFYGA